ncbi:MAG: hypothetical protein ACAI38_00585 [Myxococcota bacterium]
MRRLLLPCLFAVAACSPRTEPVLTLADDDELETDVDELAADAETPNPSLCTFAGLALCDGFEQPQVQSPPWYFVNYAASVTLDTERFFRGTRALHVRTDAEPDPERQGVRMGEITQTAVVPQDTFYARVFAYVQTPLPGRTFRMLGLLQADAPNEGPMLWIDDGNLTLSANAAYVRSATSLPLDRWTCLEWRVLSGVTGEMQFWVDGAEVTDLAYSGDTSMAPQPVGRFSIGAALFGDTATRPPLDIWYDELGLDDARIGCSR